MTIEEAIALVQETIREDREEGDRREEGEEGRRRIEALTLALAALRIHLGRGGITIEEAIKELEVNLHGRRQTDAMFYKPERPRSDEGREVRRRIEALTIALAALHELANP